MNAAAVYKRFLDFFAAREHAVLPSASLAPDDPSVLFTSAGMQQFKRYYTGELDARKDFGSLNTASVQKCFRTSDLDEVGDASHLTFFQMLGNFSFGGYWKEEAIRYAHEFITKEMKLAISHVAVFKGSNAVPKDEESKKIWRSVGVTDIREEGMEEVFWGPTGAEGPCGPTTEIYVKNAGGDDIEVWNIVFNEFYCTGSREELLAGDAKLEPLETKGIDTGMGFERLLMVAQKTPTIFETDLFAPLMALFPPGTPERIRRVVADHVRGIAFLLSDGIRPSNKEAGYVLRRLMRRVVMHERSGIPAESMFDAVFEGYRGWYPELDANIVLEEYRAERGRFMKTVDAGVRELSKLAAVDAPSAFRLYESFGLPFEVTKELAGSRAARLSRADFEKEFKRHQEVSRAGLEKKFGGHGLLLDTGELKAGNAEELAKATRLHTATHLLQQALRDVLGNEVEQRGSDITPERTRFDFSFPRKITGSELEEVERMVNKKILEDVPVGFAEMPKEEAIKIGALHFFKAKYPDRVKVYFVGRDLSGAYSREFCGGPHVSHTGEIGIFRITKEEAVSAGIRRIRAVVEEL